MTVLKNLTQHQINQGVLRCPPSALKIPDPLVLTES